jgi:hypothetical protein
MFFHMRLRTISTSRITRCSENHRTIFRKRNILCRFGCLGKGRFHRGSLCISNYLCPWLCSKDMDRRRPSQTEDNRTLFTLNIRYLMVLCSSITYYRMVHSPRQLRYMSRWDMSDTLYTSTQSKTNSNYIQCIASRLRKSCS